MPGLEVSCRSVVRPHMQWSQLGPPIIMTPSLTVSRLDWVSSMTMWMQIVMYVQAATVAMPHTRAVRVGTNSYSDHASRPPCVTRYNDSASAAASSDQPVSEPAHLGLPSGACPGPWLCTNISKVPCGHTNTANHLSVLR